MIINKLVRLKSVKIDLNYLLKEVCLKDILFRLWSITMFLHNRKKKQKNFWKKDESNPKNNKK